MLGTQIIRQTFLGSLFWFDLQATQNLTFVLAVLVVLCGCLLGTVVILGPLKRMARLSLTCLFLPAALACLFVGHTVMGMAILFFIYVVALRGVRGVNLAYDELIRLREESVEASRFLEMNNKKLLLANQSLEKEMSRRALIEADRAKLQEELVESSRQAGKAEVATGVLHNVGNVMNSVNVSACILQEDLQKKLLQKLDASIDLLGDHESDLATFFSDDKRAKHFVPFLRQLRNQTCDMVDDIDRLLSNVRHVNDVVASQQAYAMNGSHKVKADPISIVESALQIAGERFRASGIDVRTDFKFSEELLIEKSKLLQVLVNILKNAANSISDSRNEDRKVSILVEKTNEQLRIAVSDTGIGIATDNFEKIFQHGYSTRKERGGHGFGLHHSAIAIGEMGGKLAVDSPGQNQGATFTIEHPLPQLESVV